MTLHPEVAVVQVPEVTRGPQLPADAFESGVAPPALPPEGDDEVERRPVRSDDGRYEAFVDEGRATLVVRDLQTGAVHRLVDQHFMRGSGGANIFAAGRCTSLVIGYFTHMRACIEPFRVVDLHMEGR